MFCTKCGAAVEDGVKFCPNCGQPMEQVAPAPQPEPQPVPQPEPQPVYQQPQPVYQQPQPAYQPPQQPAYQPAAQPQQPVYQQTVYQNNVYQQPAGPQPSTLAFGILSLIFCGGGLLGLIFGAIGRGRGKRYPGTLTGASKAGYILSTIGMIVGIIMTIFWVVYLGIIIVGLIAAGVGGAFDSLY